MDVVVQSVCYTIIKDEDVYNAKGGQLCSMCRIEMTTIGDGIVHCNHIVNCVWLHVSDLRQV